MTKQGPKPPIHRENVFGKDDPAHQSKTKLDSAGSGHGGERGWPSMVGKDTLRAAMKAIPKT